VNKQFSYNDIAFLSVPARALKPKKLFLGAFFLLIALLLYDVFTYLAFLAEDKSFCDVWAAHGFFPLKLFCFDSFLATFLYYYLGFLFTGLALMTGFTAIAIIDIEDLRGNPFMSFKQALKFSLGRFKQNLLAILTIAIFILFIILLLFLVGLITRIPVIGEFIYSLFFFFPSFVVSILVMIVIFTGSLSLLILPAATAADRLGETFNSLLELFLTVTRQPVRWILLTAYSLVTAKVCSFIFAYFSYRAVQFMAYASELGGGAKIDNIIASGMAHLPWNSPLVTFADNIFPGLCFGFDLSCLTTGNPGNPAGYLMAVMLFLIFLLIWGYIISVIATGQAYAIAIIKARRDGYKISDEKPLFFEEEYINPPIDDTESK